MTSFARLQACLGAAARWVFDGRLKDLISRGGEEISFEEAERSGRIGDERLIRDFPAFVARKRAKSILATAAPEPELITGGQNS